MKRLKPSRRDLLLVIGHLQHLIGHAMSRFNDRNPNRQEDVEKALNKAFTLCIDARGFDPIVEGGSKRGWNG